MAKLTSTLDIRMIDDVSKPAKTVAEALRETTRRAAEIQKVMSDSGASNRFAVSLSKLRLSAKDIDAVAEAWRVYQSSAGLAKTASEWTKAQAADVRRWESQTISALRSVQREQQRFQKSLDGGARRAPIAQALPTAVVTQAHRNGVHDTVTGLAVGYAAHRAVHLTGDLAKRYAKADDTLRYQGAIADLSDSERTSRYNQGIALGPRYGLSPTDIYKAQEKLAGRGVKKEFVEPFTAQLVSYAKAMNTPIEEAAKTLETITFSTNQNVEDVATANQVMGHQIDIAVKAAKLGGLNNEDIQAGAKFGAGTAHGAGFKNETIFALLAALSRAGYHGDEGGVATRAIASHLVAPTKKGREALQIAGIDYAKYTTHPNELGVGGLESLLQTRFGKKLNKGQRDRLEAVLGDADLVNKPGDFVTEVSSILSESFEKSKSGKTKAQDAQKIAKLASDFLQKSTSSVDVEGLLLEILHKRLGIGLLNDIFTDKHGGKVSALSEKADIYAEIIEALRHLNDGFADTIASKRMEGVSGALSRAEAATEAFTLQVGRANESLIKFSTDIFSNAVTKASNAPPEMIQAATVGVGALTLAGIAGAAKAYLAGAGVGGAVGSGFGTVASILSNPYVLTAAAVIGAGYELNKAQSPEQKARTDAYRLQVGEGKGTTAGLAVTQDNLRRANASGPLSAEQVRAQNAAADDAMDALHAKAAETGEAVKSALNVTVQPQIDSAPLDAYIAKIAQAEARLRALGPLAAGLGSIGPHTFPGRIQSHLNTSFGPVMQGE